MKNKSTAMRKSASYTESAVSIRHPRFTAAVITQKDADAVFLRMALPAGSWFAEAGKEPIAGLTASLLDEGTETMTREVFRSSLESKGSRVMFWNDGRNVYASIDATTRALPEALRIAFDALSRPLLSEENVRQVIDRQSEEYVHASEDTGTQSESAFLRLLYKPNTPFYIRQPLEYRTALLSLTRADVVDFFKNAYRGALTVTAIGNITATELEKLLSDATVHWNPESALSERAIVRENGTAFREAYVPVSGKESVDVHVGAAVPVTPIHEDASALRVVIDLLGGGFSDHLMQTIRDRDGLTYGTYARLKPREFGKELYWYAAATFGNALFEKGVASLKRELDVFLKSGITPKRLAEKKEELYGRYAVLFANPERAAFPLLMGFLATGTPHDTDVYLEHVEKLTAEELKKVANTYLVPSALAASGSINADGTLAS